MWMHCAKDPSSLPAEAGGSCLSGKNKKYGVRNAKKFNMVVIPQLDFRLFLKAYPKAQLFVYACCFNGLHLYLCRER